MTLQSAANSKSLTDAAAIRLAAGTLGYAEMLRQWGWRSVSADAGITVTRQPAILLVDFNVNPGEAKAALDGHNGPALAIIGTDDEAHIPDLLTLGVTHFVFRGDEAQLRASLLAAAAMLSSADAEPRRRQTDNGADRLAEWLNQRSKYEKSATLILTDFSAVERINSAHGTAVGDLLLLRASRRLAAFSRRTDLTGATLIRISGSRFCLAAPQQPSDSRIDFLLNELLAELSRPYVENGENFHLASAVAATALREGEASAVCFSRAKAVLDRAVGASPAIATEIGGEGQAHAYDEHQIEKDLRHAVRRGEIEIVYQPQFAFSDDRIVGAEALARWNHDKYGPLGAGVLFSVAERSDYLVPLSHYIHERALSDAADWNGAQADLRLSLNVTPQDLAQPKFVEGFLMKLNDSGFAPQRLTLEITENGLMADIEANAELLAVLRRHGLSVAADDFGTGYSSLAWLKDLPLDYVKMDHGLTADIMNADRGRIVVQSVIALGKALGLKIVAEGVETEEQRASLAAEGCDYYQGFLRAQPMSADDFAAFVARGN